ADHPIGSGNGLRMEGNLISFNKGAWPGEEIRADTGPTSEDIY
ncbi:unnamed protein product, partial [marine sediment metagenome]